MHAWVHTSTHVYMYAPMHERTYACMHVLSCAYLHVPLHAYAYMYLCLQLLVPDLESSALLFDGYAVESKLGRLRTRLAQLFIKVHLLAEHRKHWEP